MSVEGWFRVVGAVVGAALLAYLGFTISGLMGWLVTPLGIVILGLLGAAGGFLLAPYVTTRPLQSLRNRMAAMSSERLTALIAGLLLGLVAAALFSIPLSFLPSPLREVLPIVSALILCYLMASVLTMRHGDLRALVQGLQPSARQEAPAGARATDVEDVILLDTSVIIDGRITDISKTGFIRSTLLVPELHPHGTAAYRRQCRFLAPQPRPAWSGSV